MLGFVAIGITGVSLLLNIVGLAIPYWQSFEFDFGVISGSTHMGLWKSCTETEVLGQSTSECSSLSSATSELKATRAFVILAMLVLVGALVCALLKLAVMKEMELLPKVAGACAIAAGVLMIIGVIIYAAKVKGALSSIYGANGIPGVDDHLHAGFALTIVAAVGSLAAGGLFFFDKGNSFNNSA